MTRSLVPLRQPALVLVLGFAAFLLFTGGAILDPRNTRWLLSGDPASSWLGWQFFRHTPLWQWPLGANPAYGMEVGSSIVFSDSVPLLAFLFKPLSPWLPAEFQYFGAWLAACFMLQAWFGWKLLRQLGLDPVLALLGAVFFATAPAMIFRLHGHYALTAHWLVLAGIYLYFRPVASRGRWLLLLGTAALVHAYLLVMVMALFAADLVQRRWSGEWSSRRSLGTLVLGLSLVAALMWAAGYFVLGGIHGVQVDQAAFGSYGMNLDALVDPENLWSRLLVDQPGDTSQYEGFAFAGTGMLLLAAIAFPLLAESSRPGPRARWLPIVTVAMAMALFSLSSRVWLGSTELFSYTVPGLLQPFTGAFRVAGRFFWPAYYLLFTGLFVVLARGLRPGTGRVVVAAMLLVQLADGAGAWRHFTDMLSRGPGWTSPMRSTLWEPLAAQYASIAIATPRNLPSGWIPLAEFASRHGMPTQAGSFARIDEAAAGRARRAMITALRSGRADTRALYVVVDDATWSELLAAPKAGAFLGVVDGFRLFAPAGCAGCNAYALKRADASGGHSPGHDIWRFQAGSPDVSELDSGWSTPEAWGTWSDGPAARVRVGLEPIAGDLDLVLVARPFVSDTRPLQRVRVFLGDVSLGQLDFTDPAVRERRLRVPHDLAAAAGPVADLRFAFPDAVSPAALGQSIDARPLALGIESLRVEAIAAPVAND